MAEVIIRKAVEQDHFAILSMPVKLAKHLSNSHDETINPDWFESKNAKEFYYDFLKDENKCLYVAETTSKEIIGFIVGELFDPTEYWYRKINCLASLNEIFVSEEHRSSGIGKKLFDKFTEWCKEKGVDRINVEVSSTNINAILFYQKFGFENQYNIMEMPLEPTYKKETLIETLKSY